MARRAKSVEPEEMQRAGGSTGAKSEAEEPPLRPGQCREYMRRTLAREFRGIVQGFVEGAKAGSCQHVKLATELMKTPTRTQVRGRGDVQRLLEKLEREAG